MPGVESGADAVEDAEKSGTKKHEAVPVVFGA